MTEKKILRLDGATGTELIKRGLVPGVCPEQWCVDHPDAVISVQQAYCRAGSDLVYVPSFGGNPEKLAEFGLEDKTYDLNYALARLSRQACLGKMVFGDLAPTGKLVEPNGPFAFEAAIEVYRKQAQALLDGGVDGFVIETMMDVQEARAALLAVRGIAPDVPVLVTMTFEPGGKTLTGCDPVAALTTFQSLGADAFGCNCSTGPDEMAEIIRAMKPFARIPLIAKPNAGMPRLEGDKTVFPLDADAFGKAVLQLVDAGAGLLGGCCGTSPAHIAALDKALGSLPPPQVSAAYSCVISSPQEYRILGADTPFTVIGERINPTGKKALQAELRAGSFDLVRRFAIEQRDAGATVLDINVGVSGIDQNAVLRRTIAETMKTVSLPLAIDSTIPEAVENALRFYPGRALLNSISAEQERLEKVLPIAAKYGAVPILLPLSDNGIPATCKERIALLEKILTEVEKYGYSPADCLADALIMTISTAQDAALQALDFISYCSDVLKMGTTCGLSNISFGLPDRPVLNNVFLGLACGRGLSSAIVHPGAPGIAGTVDSANALRALDPGLKTYIAKHAGITAPEKSAVSGQTKTPEMLLRDAVVNSQPDAVPAAVQSALDAGNEPGKLVNEILIPALTEVGDRFERKEYFLPQLMQSAQAMHCAMEILEPKLKAGGARNDGPVFVLATVQGDIHDIGKNIVRLLLENHNFNVIDLGKDVPADLIISTAVRENAVCIGLSALMTTTMPKMREVTEQLKAAGSTIPVIVGGAAVDAAFAENIGAIYAEDAMATVRAALNISAKK